MRRNLLGANQSNKAADTKEIDSLIDNPADGSGTSTASPVTEELVVTPTSATASNQVKNHILHPILFTCNTWTFTLTDTQP